MNNNFPVQKTFTSKLGTHTATFMSDGYAFVDLGNVTLFGVTYKGGSVRFHRQADGEWLAKEPAGMAVYGANYGWNLVELSRTDRNTSADQSSAKGKVASIVTPAFQALLASGKGYYEAAATLASAIRKTEKTAEDLASAHDALRKATSADDLAGVAFTAAATAFRLIPIPA